MLEKHETVNCQHQLMFHEVWSVQNEGQIIRYKMILESHKPNIYIYIKLGFMCSRNQECPILWCVICSNILENSTYKPSLFHCHFETRHPTQTYKLVDLFKCKLLQSRSSIANFTLTISVNNENALEALYWVSHWAAKALEAHTTVENPICPCIKDTIQWTSGEKAAKYIHKVHFPINTLPKKN